MIDLRFGDCLTLMQDIPSGSVNLILCDLPYGITKAKWDVILPFNKLWEQYERVISEDGAIVLFGNEPFSSMLRMSNENLYRYDWKWIKNRATGFANSNYRPMKMYEDIMVFSKANASAGGKANAMVYNPQGLKSINKAKRNVPNRQGSILKTSNVVGKNNILNTESEYTQEYTNYPNNLLYYDCEVEYLHPTQKPIPLLEYLIKTYTSEKDLVLDSCMGSGSTGVACKLTNRNFIGIELNEDYFKIAKERIANTYVTHKLF